MSKTTCNEISDCLPELRELSSSELGREKGFVQRRSKLTAGLFVKTLVLGLLEKGNSSLTALRQVTHQVLLVYRLRWQIELIFKLWKSQAKLTTIRYDRPDRILSVLYAHLLDLLIFQALIASYRTPADGFELNPVKAFQLFHHAYGV